MVRTAVHPPRARFRCTGSAALGTKWHVTRNCELVHSSSAGTHCHSHCGSDIAWSQVAVEPSVDDVRAFVDDE